MCEIKCYEDMTRDEQLNYISEHDGYVEENIGYLSDGGELRCDCCGISMRVKTDRFFVCGVEVDEEAFWKMPATGFETEDNNQDGVDFKIERHDLGE